MILTAAQTKPKEGDIKANLSDHYRFIELAAKNGANMITFPEMSITGYEREKAYLNTFTENDNRLINFKELAVKHKIIIVAGAPIKMGTNTFIGSFIFLPNDTIKIYTKQFLHEGEEEYFKSSFDYNPTFLIENQKISLAICADIDNPQHVKNAFNLGSSFYIPSIFFSLNGIPNAHKILSNYSKKYSLNILMSNFVNLSWNTQAGGKSAFWKNDGELLISMNESDSGLLIVEKNKDKWRSNIILDN